MTPTSVRTSLLFHPSHLLFVLALGLEPCDVWLAWKQVVMTSDAESAALASLKGLQAVSLTCGRMRFLVPGFRLPV